MSSKSGSTHDPSDELTQHELLMISSTQKASKEKRKRKRKDSGSGVTNLKKIIDTPRSRIEKKIFDK